MGTKTSQMLIRLEPERHEHIKATASAANLSVSQYVLNCVDMASNSTLTPTDYAKAMVVSDATSAIRSGNTNQIAVDTTTTDAGSTWSGRSTRHCCACDGVCYHVGGPYYCSRHDPYWSRQPAQPYVKPYVVPYVPPAAPQVKPVAGSIYEETINILAGKGNKNGSKKD